MQRARDKRRERSHVVSYTLEISFPFLFFFKLVSRRSFRCNVDWHDFRTVRENISKNCCGAFFFSLSQSPLRMAFYRPLYIAPCVPTSRSRSQPIVASRHIHRVAREYIYRNVQSDYNSAQAKVFGARVC